MTNPIHYLSATAVGTALRDGELTSEHVTSHLLSRINELDPLIGAYSTVTAESALRAAKVADDQIRSGRWKGLLHGVPVALKDILFTTDAPTTVGMGVLRNWSAPYEATAVSRLRAAGAVILGKQKMTEGAYGAYHPSVSPPLNPWNDQYWTGHSSSGSGVATAAGLCFASVGTDTGGSIRFPASANGLFGLKPTWGAVSTYGVFPMSPSLDHVGPLARSVHDLAAMMDAMAGWSSDDAMSLKRSGYALERIRDSARRPKVGFDRRILEQVSPDVSKALLLAARALSEAGAEVVEVLLPDFLAASEAWLPICARDMVHSHKHLFDHAREHYGSLLREFIEFGLRVTDLELSSANHDRQVFLVGLEAVFEEVDHILLPVHPASPMTLESLKSRPREPSRMTSFKLFTTPFNLSGHPALSMPAIQNQDGAPVGVQLVGRRGEDQYLLRTGAAYERLTELNQVHPLLK